MAISKTLTVPYIYQHLKLQMCLSDWNEYAYIENFWAYEKGTKTFN